MEIAFIGRIGRGGGSGVPYGMVAIEPIMARKAASGEWLAVHDRIIEAIKDSGILFLTEAQTEKLTRKVVEIVRQELTGR